MTSQVYYRKWRPNNFANLAGQKHIRTTIQNAIIKDRISHSYLFCGPRGTGKTSTARILAKAVNCLNPDSGDPCNDCDPCVSFNDGTFLDLIELDAASNRGIDDIREIREKINFSPVKGRRKVYIIDEAHMLTPEAENAFLKTLEEPPKHIMFILCTTEMDRIAPTIISRCQRFDFKLLSSDDICYRLSEIIQAEHLEIDNQAIAAIARFASGSLRDAENLLDQISVSSDKGITLSHVEDLLGISNRERWLELVDYMMVGNTSASLTVLNQAAWEGANIKQIQTQVMELLRALMLLKWSADTSLNLPEHIIQHLKDLLGQIPTNRLSKAIKTWQNVDLRHDASTLLPLELATVEICDYELEDQHISRDPQKPSHPIDQSATLVGQSSKLGQPPKISPSPTKVSTVDPKAKEPVNNIETHSTDNGQTASFVQYPEDSIQGQWINMVKALRRCQGKKYNLGALLRDCKVESVYKNTTKLIMPFSNRTNLERMQEEMQDPQTYKIVQEAVSLNFSNTQEFELSLNEDKGSGEDGQKVAQNSPLVRAAIGMGARIVEEIT
ncbi:MAG: DNA polymerase III subunit gamma/tau [Chloroflexota bacterium]|nr:DNA polymerase III subunit gamma/tau [Chloroflexota bacterium]